MVTKLPSVRYTHSYLSLELKYLHEQVLFLSGEPPHGFATFSILRRVAGSSTAVVWLKSLLHLHIGITESPM